MVQLTAGTQKVSGTLDCLIDRNDTSCWGAFHPHEFMKSFCICVFFSVQRDVLSAVKSTFS